MFVIDTMSQIKAKIERATTLVTIINHVFFLLQSIGVWPMGLRWATAIELYIFLSI